MYMLYTLILGDWSRDGHKISQEFLFDCNYDVSEMRQAYKDSCKKLGISFNCDENYTGFYLSYHDDRLIWTEYQECDISETAFRILYKAGCFNGIPFKKLNKGEKIRYYIEDRSDCAMLVMNFIALSMPQNFHYHPIKINKKADDTINGLWNNELNTTFGYGLFD